MITGSVLANAGTPLMWAGMIHLVIGNLFIGILEGLLLGFIFRLSKWKSILWMIAANYVSSWAGMIIIEFAKHNFEDITIYQVTSYLWTALFIAYLFTLFLEWPFIWAVMKNKTRRLGKSVLAAVILQTASYALLAGFWYYPSSGTGLFDHAEITHSLDFINNNTATVYFIGQDKNIYQISIDGLHVEKIYEPAKKQDLMKLYLKVNPDSGNADLCVSLLKDIYTEWEETTYIVKKDVLSSSQLKRISQYDRQIDMSYEATDFRLMDQRQWSIRTGFWAAEGLYFWNNQTQERRWISLETPFIQWYVRNATVLPGDEVVFQLGNQICMYSRTARKLALLSIGTSPVTIMTD